MLKDNDNPGADMVLPEFHEDERQPICESLSNHYHSHILMFHQL